LSSSNDIESFGFKSSRLEGTGSLYSKPMLDLKNSFSPITCDNCRTSFFFVVIVKSDPVSVGTVELKIQQYFR
jgi:hypothetical protein